MVLQTLGTVLWDGRRGAQGLTAALTHAFVWSSTFSFPSFEPSPDEREAAGGVPQSSESVMTDKFDEQLFKRLEELRGRMVDTDLDALEKRLDEADRSVAYHTHQAAEAHSPDLRNANLEIIEKRRREIAEIAAELDML
jgi:hypothetical protein